MNIKLTIFALGMILTILPTYGQGLDEVPLFKAQNEGKVIDYSISSGRAKKLQKWDPIKQVVPLQIHEAVAKALAWIKKRNPKIDSFVPSRIELGKVSYGEFNGLWYYTVGFDGVVGGEQMHSWGLQAVVLMDGSIVEPQQEH
jgi:hypothetical protein